MVSSLNVGDPQTRALAQKGGERIQITRIFNNGTEKHIYFKGFVTSLEKSAVPNFVEPENAFGNQGKARLQTSITFAASLGFDVPSASIEEAKRNSWYVDTLYNFMSPEIDADGNQVGTPVFRVKYMSRLKMVCTITEFKIAPELEQGAFIKKNEMFPKLYKISLDLQEEVREKTIGWRVVDDRATYDSRRGVHKNFKDTYHDTSTGGGETTEDIALLDAAMARLDRGDSTSDADSGRLVTRNLSLDANLYSEREGRIQRLNEVFARNEILIGSRESLTARNVRIFRDINQKLQERRDEIDAAKRTLGSNYPFL